MSLGKKPIKRLRTGENAEYVVKITEHIDVADALASLASVPPPQHCYVRSGSLAILSDQNVPEERTNMQDLPYNSETTPNTLDNAFPHLNSKIQNDNIVGSGEENSANQEEIPSSRRSSRVRSRGSKIFLDDEWIVTTRQYKKRNKNAATAIKQLQNYAENDANLISDLDNLENGTKRSPLRRRAYSSPLLTRNDLKCCEELLLINSRKGNYKPSKLVSGLSQVTPVIHVTPLYSISNLQDQYGNILPSDQPACTAENHATTISLDENYIFTDSVYTKSRKWHGTNNSSDRATMIKVVRVKGKLKERNYNRRSLVYLFP